MILFLCLVLLVAPYQFINGGFDFARLAPTAVGLTSLCVAGCCYRYDHEHNKGIDEAHKAEEKFLNESCKADDHGKKQNVCKNYLRWYKQKKGNWPLIGGEEFIEDELKNNEDYLNKKIKSADQLNNVFQRINNSDLLVLSRKIIDIAQAESALHWKKTTFFLFLEFYLFICSIWK